MEETAITQKQVTPPQVVERTFPELVSIMTAVDEGLVADIDMSEVREQLEHKVDSYKYVLDRIESYEVFLKNRIEEFKKNLEALTNNKERLKGLMCVCMSEAKFEKLPGKLYNVRLQYSERLTTSREPQFDDLAQYANYIRTKVEWDKEKIKADVKTGADLPFASLSKHPHIRFYVNKGE